LEPDPDQTLSLTQLAPGETMPTAPVTLRARTALVQDHNGHPVGDGTQVMFEARDAMTGQILTVETTATVQGVAEGELELTAAGEVEIVARSGNAKTAAPLRLTLLAPLTPTVSPLATPSTGAVEPVTPSATATERPAHTPTVRTARPTPAPTPGATSQARPQAGKWNAGPWELLGALGGLMLALTTGYRWQGQPLTGLTGRIRWGLAVWIGGLAGYLLFGFGIMRPSGWLSWPVGLILALTGGLAGGFIAVRGKGRAP
jgi:hypothetical protein